MHKEIAEYYAYLSRNGIENYTITEKQEQKSFNKKFLTY